MFGVCTKEQNLSANDYCNLIGLDKHGWSLSHKGHLWHNGECNQYTSIFPEHGTVKIGLFFDTMRGQLSYFMVSILELSLLFGRYTHQFYNTKDY